MSIQLRIVGSDDPHRELASLWDWVGRESLLRGHIRAESQPIRPDEMGGLEEILIVAIGSGGAATMLVRSVIVWLEQRRSELRVEVTTPDGSRSEITAAGPAADQIAKLIFETAHSKENSNVVTGRAAVEGGSDRHDSLH